MTCQKEIISSLLKSTGSITINKRLMRSIGIECSIMFCELLSKESYFQERNQLTEDGWFYCTVSEMEDSTTLSEFQQKKVVTKLIKYGLIEYRVKGIPPVRYFKTTDNMQLLYEYLSVGESKKHPKPLKQSNTEETTELKPEKLRINNTNTIIQNNHNQNGLISDETKTKNIDVVNAITTYMTHLYPQRMKKQHPFLKPEQYDNVYSSIAEFADKHALDYDDIVECMLNVLNNFKLETDFNINHFATEGIMLNALYNTGKT